MTNDESLVLLSSADYFSKLAFLKIDFAASKEGVKEVTND